MLLLSGAAVGGGVAGFMLGWLAGYNKACRAHGWYLARFNWDKQHRTDYK